MPVIPMVSYLESKSSIYQLITVLLINENHNTPRMYKPILATDNKWSN